MSEGVISLIKSVLTSINNNKKVLIISEYRKDAADIYNALLAVSSFFLHRQVKTFLFNYDEYEPFMKISPVAELLSLKLESLCRLTEKEAFDVIIIPYKALIQKTIPYQVLCKNLLILRNGMQISQREISDWLLRLGYMRENVVDMKGRFSIRGEIIDIFSVNQRFAARLIMMGTFIEKIRYFDIETQRGFKDIEEYEVIPVSEFIIEEDMKKNTIENIKYVASESGLPAIKIREYIDELDTSFEYNLKSYYLPFMYNYECSTVMEYISANLGGFDAVDLFLSDYNKIIEDVEEYYKILENNYSALLEVDKIVPPFESFVPPKSDIRDLLNNALKTDLSVEVVDIETLLTKFKLYCKKDSNVSIEDIRSELNLIVKKYKKIVFLYRDDGQKKIFLEMFQIMGVKYSEDTVSDDNVIIKNGNIFRSFVLDNILFIPLSDIIKEKKIYDYDESIYDKIKMLRLRFKEIKTDDYVVHRDFGVGVYRGLKKIHSDGGIQDYIIIEYKDKRLLYLPALNIDMISKYESGVGKSPAISVLGKDHWQNKKIKIKEELLKFASEILRIKAQRKLIKKKPIGDTDEMYDRFCEGFEYNETPDQLRCIEEVKRDLMSEYPMERIVCGDVGFGKTEIIMRAAFIIASAGYQVAILVPTTILAEQHYYNFQQRLKDFPIRIAMLSRFVSDEESSKIIRDIRDGKVDIVIGTHKILTSGVQFKNIRLLVIDEEQKFGVEQKEQIKKQNPALDVLITTATPIPRTLHMGFADLIDLSVLTTAPEGRIPVRTIISRFDEEVIRNAILKEIKRDGQVFFVNPRIGTIDSMAKHIGSLLPGLRIAVAHGRMPVDKIEEVMHSFYQKRYDLLVSTNIIGSGLDLPNVNTIIVNSSELFGLSELYQLRGRVGRGRINAYAYFLFSTLSNLTQDIKRKMDVLYRHQGLGAGFNIASEDLELRGAGEILGKKQAGFIDGIGFDLYNELLRDALSEIQGIPSIKLPETDIRIDMPVYIPDDYIDDVSIRLNFYHRFSAANSEQAIDDLLTELIDRFGEYPDEVKNLSELSKIKIKAKMMGITNINQHRNSITIVFGPSAGINMEKMVGFIEKYQNQVKITPDSKLIINYGESENIFDTLRIWLSILEELY